MIGLIFGDSDFPKEVLKKIKRKKFKYLIIDLSKKRSFKKDNNSKRVSIGQFGKIINLVKYKILPIIGDASFRQFYRIIIKKKNKILVFSKKDKNKNLIIYSAINKFLRRNKIMPVNLYKGEQRLTESLIGVENNLFNNPGAWKKLAYFNHLDKKDKSLSLEKVWLNLQFYLSPMNMEFQISS